MKLSRLLLIVLILFGLTTGYWLGHRPSLQETPWVGTMTAPERAPAIVPSPSSQALTSEDPQPEVVATLSADEIAQRLIALVNAFQLGTDDFAAFHRQKRLLLRNLSPEMLKEVLTRLSTVTVEKSKSWMINQLLMELGEGDPASTYQILQQRGEKFAQWELGGILANWYQNDPEAALAALSVPENKKSKRLLQSFLNSLAATNSQEALRLAETELGENLPDYALGNILGELAMKDPNAAASYALQIQNPRQRVSAIQQMMWRWLSKDFSGALAWSQSLPEGKDRDAALGSAISNWIDKNPDEAVAYLTSLPEGKEKQKLISRTSYNLVNLGADKALPLIEAMPEGEEKRQALFNFSDRWVQTNPQEASEYLAKLPGSSNVTQNLQSGLQAWSQKDPQAALDFALQLDPAQRHQILPQLLGQLAETQPEIALKTALATFDRNAMGTIAKTMATANPQQALSIRLQVPAGSLRDAFVTQVMQAWAASDPKAASALVPTLNSGAELRNSIDALANPLVKLDESYAKQWAMQLPDREFARPKAVFLVSQALHQQDPAKATAYIDSFPMGQLKDQATRGMSWAIVEKQPAQALNLLVTVAEVPKRDREALAQFKTWKDKDASAAQQWLQQASVPDDLRKKLSDAK